MTIGRFLVPALLLVGASPTFAAVQVLGSSSARMCFEAAESPGKPTTDSLQKCDSALDEEGLTLHDQVATYVNRGILRMRLDRLDEAVGDSDHAIRFDPDEPEAYLNKGMATLRRNDGPAALALFDIAIAKKTSRPALAYYGRAVAQEMAGNIREAYRDYRQASLLEPKWREPKIELSRFTVRDR